MTAIPSFTGDANPYGGGDPYADYRTADFPFTHWPPRSSWKARSLTSLTTT